MNILQLFIKIGFIIFCFGIASRVYMDVIYKRACVSRKCKSSILPELRYYYLVKQKRAPVWPIVIDIICIPLGFTMCVSAIILYNNLTMH